MAIVRPITTPSVYVLTHLLPISGLDATVLRNIRSSANVMVGKLCDISQIAFYT